METAGGYKKNIDREAKLPSIGREDSWALRDGTTKLRRPHGALVNQSAETSVSKITEQLGTTQISEKKTFTLSPDAAVFVPRHLRPPSPVLPQKSSMQNRLIIAREMPPNIEIEPTITDHIYDASQESYNTTGAQIQYNNLQNYNEFNGCYEDYLSYHDSGGPISDTNEDASNYEMYQELENIIYTLTANPGEFNRLVPQFISVFGKDRNPDCLKLIVTTIIDSSIAESNFRYNGARFCTYFDDFAESNEQSYFRNILYRSCQDQIEEQVINWHSPDDNYDPKKCYGLILFLAELVAQMNESFALTLGGLLIHFIINILRRPASNIVKYVCQALKLAGQRLEKDKSKSTEIESMMRALTDIVTRGQVDTQVGDMVHSVHELRNDNWGRSAFNSGSCRKFGIPTQQTPDQPGVSHYNSFKTKPMPLEQVSQSLDEVLLYGPDGELILSAEESKFLQDHIKSSNQGISEEIYEEPDDNYDEEIAIAYEEFLRDKSNLK